jgi:hypothetical protein
MIYVIEVTNKCAAQGLNILLNWYRNLAFLVNCGKVV